MRLLVLSFVATIFAIGCTTNKTYLPAAAKDSSAIALYPPGGGERLYDTRWTFVEMAGQPVSLKEGGEPAGLAFYPGQVGRVSGFTGCNQLNGTFTLADNNSLTFSPLLLTKKYCEDVSVQEKEISAVMGQVTHFYVVNNELLFVNGQQTIARLRPQTKSPTPTDNGLLPDAQLRNLNELLLQGVEFIASGNEPFWSLQIDRKKGMKFKLAGGDSINTPPVNEVRLQDVAASSFRAVTEKGSLTVVVYDKECINDMSGAKLPKKIELTYNNKRYTGCGRYLSDYRLNDIWKLVSINNVPIDAKKLQKGVPTLEINSRDGHVLGHSGCNGFGGPLEVKGRYLTIRRLTGTMMFCEDDGFEKRYYELLSPREIAYEIKPGKLSLFVGNEKLQYQKID